jgi:4-amino-4-deoxy-L-arabinose transferase-like glycosyltransferase
MGRVATGVTARAIREAVAIALVAVVVLGIDLGARVLGNNDEARFPMLAQDVLARADWLHPRLDGVVYANKPVLLAWLIALVSWPVGHVTQLTAALPSAAAGLATVLLVYAFGCDLLGREAGWFAALVALTMQGLYVHARLAMPDMLMTCFITASMWMLARVIRGDEQGISWLGFYALSGVAFWSKGPAGLLPLVVALVHHVATRRSERRPPLRAIAGLALVAVFVALWYLLSALGNASATRQAIVVDQLAWYRPRLPSLANVTEPVRDAFGILFPWVLVTPLVVTQAVRFCRGRGAERDRVLLLLEWAGVTFVLITLSREQRLRYYLPLVSPLALLTGWWAAGVVVKHRRVAAIPWRVYAIVAGVVVATTAAFLVSKGWSREARVELPGSVIEIAVSAVALLAFVSALWIGVSRQRLGHAVAIASVASAVFLVATYHGEVKRRNVDYDFARVAATVHPLIEDRELVFAWGVAALPVSFYLGHAVIPVESEAELRAAVAPGTAAIVVVRDRTLPLVVGPSGMLLARERFGPGEIGVVRWAGPRRSI